jgi:hypothetical protein
MLIQPKLYAPEKGEGAFWKDFDWKRAAEVGMRDANLPFSGNVSFIHTEMFLPVNHMVSTKEQSVACTECHSRHNSRLAGLKDFYMPARDYSPLIDGAGAALILLSLIGVVSHGTIRIVFALSKKKRGQS